MKPSKTCEWVEVEDQHDPDNPARIFKTDCQEKWWFTDCTPDDVDFKFCYKCGRPINWNDFSNQDLNGASDDAEEW